MPAALAVGGGSAPATPTHPTLSGGNGVPGSAPATATPPAPSWQQTQAAPPANAAPPRTVGLTSTGNTNVPAPAPVDPRDATYYDTLARLGYAQSTTLAGLGDTFSGDQAAYTSGVTADNTQLPLTLAATRDTYGGRGLLESGIEANKAGLDEAANTQKTDALLAKWNAQQSTIGNDITKANNTYNTGVATDFAGATARAAKNDLATSPITPVPPAPASKAAVKSEANAIVKGVGATVGSAVKAAAAAKAKAAKGKK